MRRIWKLYGWICPIYRNIIITIIIIIIIITLQKMNESNRKRVKKLPASSKSYVQIPNGKVHSGF